jgi:methylglutaconyl-CoA hydratase
MIDALLMCGPDAIAETKACTLELDGQLLGDDLVARLARMHAAKRMTPEGAEGLASFLEKRKPAWYTGDVAGINK